MPWLLWFACVVLVAALFPAMIFEEADKGNWRTAIFHAMALFAVVVFVKRADFGVYLVMVVAALATSLYQVRVRWLTPTLHDVVEPVHLGIGAVDVERMRRP